MMRSLLSPSNLTFAETAFFSWVSETLNVRVSSVTPRRGKHTWKNTCSLAALQRYAITLLLASPEGLLVIGLSIAVIAHDLIQHTEIVQAASLYGSPFTMAAVAEICLIKVPRFGRIT